MQMTSIQITRHYNTGTKLRATVSIILDDMVVIHGIKVLDSAGDFFLAMPSKTTKMGMFQDVAHPLNQNVRRVFEKLIIGAYIRTMKDDFKKVEFRLSEQTDVGLLEQTCEMFEVVSVKPNVEPSDMIDGHKKPVADELLPDNEKRFSKNDSELLKWLES